MSVSARRRTTPWIVMSIVHVLGLAITAALFLAAALVEQSHQPQANAIAAAWVTLGLFAAPLVTAGTALWWFMGRQKEPLPASPSVHARPGTSSLEHAAA